MSLQVGQYSRASRLALCQAYSYAIKDILEPEGPGSVRRGVGRQSIRVGYKLLSMVPVQRGCGINRTGYVHVPHMHTLIANRRSKIEEGIRHPIRHARSVAGCHGRSWAGDNRS